MLIGAKRNIMKKCGLIVFMIFSAAMYAALAWVLMCVYMTFSDADAAMMSESKQQKCEINRKFVDLILKMRDDGNSADAVFAYIVDFTIEAGFSADVAIKTAQEADKIYLEPGPRDAIATEYFVRCIGNGGA